MSDLISRADAIDAVAEEWLSEASAESPYVNDNDIDRYRELAEELFADIPSADAVDCTDFIEWLVDRVLDETIWENNSVAYGEIICRKLEKLGVLEATEEPSYYIRPSADAVQGEWIRHELFGNPWFTCSECNYHGRNDFNFCPNCGARMKGGAE